MTKLVHFNLLLALVTLSCFPNSNALAEIPLEPVDALFSYQQDPLPATARIFLIAGSSENANFAAEIIEQKELWLRAGFSADEIACYFIRPYQEEFEADQAQYTSLLDELSACYLASMSNIRAHLKQAATQTAEDSFIYLYVSSHGEKPISIEVNKRGPEDGFSYWARARQLRYPALDQYRISLEALPDGNAGAFTILGAYRAGTPAEELYFTAENLRSMLALFAPNLPKYAVLQACYSGGFIRAARQEDDARTLRSLQNITVLTASRFDKESFGCDSGSRRTNYGGAFNDVLARNISDPRRVNWPVVYADVEQRVIKSELQQGELDASYPQYFSNYQALTSVKEPLKTARAEFIAK